MDWAVRPPHATNLQARSFQGQGMYQLQQSAFGFSQASASTENSSVYSGNDQGIKMHAATQNMVANQLTSSNNVGSNNFQPPILKTLAPVSGFGTNQHFVHLPPQLQLSSVTVQMASKNTWPNSNVQIFSPGAPQPGTGNAVQRPPNMYIVSNISSNSTQKNSSSSEHASVFRGNRKSSHLKRLHPHIRTHTLEPTYQLADPQTHATVRPNQVSNHFQNYQPNSLCLTFSSGQNIQNQINGATSGSTIAMQQQQCASNYRYSPHTISGHYPAQVIPQATNANIPPPPYPVPPVHINHERFVQPQPLPKMSNENFHNPQNLKLGQCSDSYSDQQVQTIGSVLNILTENVQIPQNLELDQSSGSYTVQQFQTTGDVPVSRETNEVGGAADSMQKHSTENQPSDVSAVEALKSICNSLQIPDKTAIPQRSDIMTENKKSESSEKIINFIKSKPITKESLELDMKAMLAIGKKLQTLQRFYKINQKTYLSRLQKSETSDPSVNNPALSPLSSNTSQQPAHQTFSILSHNTTQKLTSMLPHENTQNQPFPAHSSSQSQNEPSLLPSTESHLYPILENLLKGTCDEEMLPSSFSANAEASVNDTKRATELGPETSQTVSTQGSLIPTDAKPTSALGKDQLTNISAMYGGNAFNHCVSKNKVGTAICEELTNPQSTIPAQSPAASSESSLLSDKLAKEGSENFRNFKSDVIQQSKVCCLQTPDKNITALKKENAISSPPCLAASVPEMGIVQRSSVTGNSRAVERACSWEELETSLALWKKSPSASLNDKLGESTKSTMNSSPLDGSEDKEMACIMKNLPNTLTEYEKISIAVGKNKPILSFEQKIDAINSSSLKSSEPQVAIVPPLILSKHKTQNDVQEKNDSSMLKVISPVIAEGSVHSLYESVHKVTHADKPVKRTACSLSDPYITVKEVHSDMHSKMAKSTKENGMYKAETGTDCSFDTNQGLTCPLQLETNTLPLYSGDHYSENSFPKGNDDNSRPVSQKCSKTSRDLVEPKVTVQNGNFLQISSVCTLVQGDAFYNSQIASIFNSSSLKSSTENNSCPQDQRPDLYHEEQHLSPLERDSEINEGDVLIISPATQSKAIAENQSNLPGAKIPQGCEVSDKVDVRDPEGGKIAELCNPDSGKNPDHNITCSDVQSMDPACDKEVLGSSIGYESSTHGIQENVSRDEIQTHSVNDTDMALTLPDDQLTELLKEFPYGIDNSKVLKKSENENSAIKLIEIKDGQEAQTCGQNSDASPAVNQIIIKMLSPQQMKELFPESSCQSSKKLESRETDTVLITSEESINSSAETAQKQANQSYCCLKGWISKGYAVNPCKCMLDKEASLKQPLDHCLAPKIIIKDEPETNETSNTGCQLNSLQQNIFHVNSNLHSEESNRLLSKTVHKENKSQQKEHKPLEDEEELISLSSLEKLNSLKTKNKQQKLKLPEKVPTNDLCNQRSTKLVSKNQELLYSGRDTSKGECVRSAWKRELSDKERTLRRTVVKSDTHRHRSMENKPSKKNEQYKIKQDSRETHIITELTRSFKRRLKKQATTEGKHKTSKRPFSTVTNSSELSSIDLISNTHNNAQHSQKHLNRQKCKIDRDSDNSKTVRTEYNESSCLEAVQNNKGSFVRTNLKKFAYPEERGKVWQNRRSHPDNIKASKLQAFRRQNLYTYKIHSSGKEAIRGAHKRDKCFQKILSDKKSPYDRKNNTLTLQREQKKSYLNKVAFKETEQSICLSRLEPSPSKSVWHVKSNNGAEHLRDKKSHTLCSQQSEVIKPQMLEFKMCPEIVFGNLVSEEVPDPKKLPEKETTPVAAVKSTREDWLNYIPLKKRKIRENETQVGCNPPDTEAELVGKNDAIKKSNATFEAYKKMHLEKKPKPG